MQKPQNYELVVCCYRWRKFAELFDINFHRKHHVTQRLLIIDGKNTNTYAHLSFVLFIILAVGLLECRWNKRTKSMATTTEKIFIKLSHYFTLFYIPSSHNFRLLFHFDDDIIIFHSQCCQSVSYMIIKLNYHCASRLSVLCGLFNSTVA